MVMSFSLTVKFHATIPMQAINWKEKIPSFKLGKQNDKKKPNRELYTCSKL